MDPKHRRTLWKAERLELAARLRAARAEARAARAAERAAVERAWMIRKACGLWNAHTCPWSHRTTDSHKRHRKAARAVLEWLKAHATPDEYGTRESGALFSRL